MRIRPASACLPMVAIVLLPVAARAQTAAVVAHDAAGQLAWRPAALPPQPRLEPPAREVSLRWASNTLTGGTSGVGVSYSRQISHAFAVEGALDWADARETGPFRLALLQLRATSSPLHDRSLYVTLGVARLLGGDERLIQPGMRTHSLAAGMGGQMRITDATGARAEIQVMRFEFDVVRVSIGGFVGWGDR